MSIKNVLYDIADGIRAIKDAWRGIEQCDAGGVAVKKERPKPRTAGRIIDSDRMAGSFDGNTSYERSDPGF